MVNRRAPRGRPRGREAGARRRRRLRSLWYYASSLPALAWGVRSRWAALRLLLRGGGPAVRIDLADGTSLLVRSALELWVAKETCLDRQYERQGVTVGEGATVLDVGASVGDFAVSVARRHPTCTVHALEPDPASYALLLANIELNRVANVVPHPVALGGEDGAVLLAVDRERPVLSSTTAAAADTSIRVTRRTLAGLLDELGLERLDLLKLDCEGAESEILEVAGAATLARVGAVCLEYHAAEVGRRLRALLQSAGFRVVRTPSPVHRGVGLLHAVATARPG